MSTTKENSTNYVDTFDINWRSNSCSTSSNNSNAQTQQSQTQQWSSESEGLSSTSVSSASVSTSTSSNLLGKQDMNAVVLKRIQEIILKILRSLAAGELPVLEHIRLENTLTIRGINNKNNGEVSLSTMSTINKKQILGESKDDNNNNSSGIDVSGGIHEVVAAAVAEPEEVQKVTQVRLDTKNSQKKFFIIVKLMSKVYELISKGETCTKRDLYYENVTFYGNQARLEQGLQDMCLVLQVPRSAIPVKATSKGLVAGSLCYKDVNGMEVDVRSSRTGLLVPSADEEIYEIQSDARFILLVEKDAVFQRFLGECIFETMEPLIMITGKGYPDFGTRKFIQVLSKELQIPVLALVDCDPHGIEIAAIVKWGSYGQANLARCTDDMYAQELIVPNLIWAGLRPSDIDSLNLRKACVEMTQKDEKKLDCIKMRLSRQPEASDWCSQIDILKSLKVKTELESLFSCGFRFATQTYLRRKVDELLNSNKVESSER